MKSLCKATGLQEAAGTGEEETPFNMLPSAGTRRQTFTGLVWDCNVGSAGILEAVSGAWTSAFMDPTSIAISDESILVYGELGAPTGMKLATADSLYYPVVR